MFTTFFTVVTLIYLAIYAFVMIGSFYLAVFGKTFKDRMLGEKPLLLRYHAMAFFSICWIVTLIISALFN